MRTPVPLLVPLAMILGCSQTPPPAPQTPQRMEPAQAPPASPPAPELPVTIRTTEELEAETKSALQALLRAHDVRRWVFTRDVAIDAFANPHSHPVLTLHARYRKSPDRLLLLFVHEQLHWYLEDPAKQQALAAAKAELAQRYPDHPAGLPEGGFDSNSTLLHLLVCWLELDAGRKLLGEAPTRTIFETPHIYGWVYRTVLKDDAAIGALIAKHGLALP